MYRKFSIPKPDINQTIRGVSIGIVFFIVWFLGLGFIMEHFSLSDGHPFIAMPFLTLPTLFGIIGFYVLNGNFFKRLIYLFFGAIAFLFLFLFWNIFDLVYSPITVDSPEVIELLVGFGILVIIFFMLGGIFSMLVEVALKNLRDLLRTRQ